jgi:hypothetical protein
LSSLAPNHRQYLTFCLTAFPRPTTCYDHIPQPSCPTSLPLPTTNPPSDPHYFCHRTGKNVKHSGKSIKVRQVWGKSQFLTSSSLWPLAKLLYSCQFSYL